MTTNITSMLKFWKEFNLPQLQRDLDGNAADLAGRQDASDASRRKLVEQSKEFKKATPEDVRKSVAPLLRSFQSEVDALSKRSKASESDFLNLYKQLIELPDPVQALEQAEQFQKRAQRLNDVETENQKLRETLAEYNKEFAEVKNQEVTIKSLREKVREYEKGKDDLAKQLTMEKSEQLRREFAEKEQKLHETQHLMATKLGEAEQMAATYKAALESSQSELFDLKSKYDEENAAKQAELDMVVSDLERMTQRVAFADKEIETLKEMSASSRGEDKKSSVTTMEESFEALSRSSLEAELASKEKEIGQLIEDVRHLQGSMGKLRESSASAIAKLEDDLTMKNDLCAELRKQIDERSDYDEIKRELRIIKSTEFSSFDAAENQFAGSSKSKSLELLLMEKNRVQQSENTSLRAANAQLTETRQRRDDNSEKTPRRRLRTPPSRSASTQDPFSPTHSNSAGAFLDPIDALSQLQLQNQRQLSALLNLKILASLKAVASQSASAAPLLSSFMNFQPIPSPKPLRSNNDLLDNANRSANYRAGDAQNLASYFALAQSAGLGRRSRSENSDQSDIEERAMSNSRNRTAVRRPSEPGALGVGGSNRRRTEAGRARSLSHTGGSDAVNNVDTDELTRQVKTVLQTNNIGQRAFGQYVLGLSQGSVSEILSKPKPWSKLTSKGKEPFYKMMEFLASPDHVDSLRTLQRRDRDGKVLCGSRTQPIRSADERTDQAITSLLPSAREEMRAKQKLNQPEDTRSHKPDTSDRKYSFPSGDNTNLTSAAMTAIASGHCMPRMSEKILPAATNGAVSPMISSLAASLPSSITARQCHASGNVNARPLTQSCWARDAAEDVDTRAQEDTNLEKSPSRWRENDGGLSGLRISPSDKKTDFGDSGVLSGLLVKSEPQGNSNSAGGYFGALNSRQGECREKDSLTSKRDSVSSSLGCESYERFATAGYEDPFIPAPLSPAPESTRSSSRTNGSCSPAADTDLSYRSPFDTSRASTVAKSPPRSEISQAPALFKELSHFRGAHREAECTSKLPGPATSFTGMLSSGMSSLPSSASLFDGQTSYTELNPVTSGSVFSATRERQELASMSNAFSGVENGISSMLPPLATSGMQQSVNNQAHTYSTSTIAPHSELVGDHPSPIPAETLQKLATAYFDTEMLTRQVRDRLIRHGICQRIFGEKILGLSQGTVSDILSHPKAWNKLTQKGKDPFFRMMHWLADDTAGGLLSLQEGDVTDPDTASRSSSTSPTLYPVNLSKTQIQTHNVPSSSAPGQYTNLSSPSSAAHSPQSSQSVGRVSPLESVRSGQIPRHEDSPPLHEPPPGHGHYNPNTGHVDHSGHALPMTPLQQMLNIQELAANCPQLDTVHVTKAVKQLLTEHNIGQRIFGQAVLGLTQGSVSDLLSRPKIWKSLSLKGREPFVRMQLWLANPNNIEQLKNLKLERWMEKKWGGKRQRTDGGVHSMSPVKKQRIVLTTDEKDVLRRAYAIEPYPSQETVELLAAKLGRKPSTIVNWFHNYRSRVKRGFFPGELARDAATASNHKKQGGSKQSVKDLLEGITLPPRAGSASNQPRTSTMNFQRSFSFKNDHALESNGPAARRSRDSGAVSSSSSWGRSDNDQSPAEYDHCVQTGRIKNESLEQHFQNLHSPDDMYAHSIMHVKDEAKMVQLQSGDAMFSPAYSYPPSSSLSDIFKPPEDSLNDSVSISSYMQPKAVHETLHYSSPPGQLFTNLDSHQTRHHKDYSPDLPNESSFVPVTSSDIPSSPSSPQSNGVLPSVYTLTPKKSTGYGQGVGLPGASSLLNSTLPSMNHIDSHVALANAQSIGHRFVNLNRPRYEMLLTGNNNMNNNSHVELMKNMAFHSDADIDTLRSSENHTSNQGNGLIWTSVTTDGTSDNSTSSPIKSEACQLVADHPSNFLSVAGKDIDDDLRWEF